MSPCLLLLVAGGALQQPTQQTPQQSQELVVPAFTAYGIPDRERFQVDATGIHHWTNPREVIEWHGYLNVGTLQPTLNVRLPAGQTVQLRLSIAPSFPDEAIIDQRFTRVRRPLSSAVVSVEGQGDQLVAVPFPKLEIPNAGYETIALQGVESSSSQYPDIESLDLKGEAVNGAHFNLKERRNAASVHLTYPVDKGTQVAWFYNEVTPRKDPLYTFYMACGFSRGYFGMQVNSRFERRIIFSVWDSSGTEDPAMYGPNDKTKLIGKGDDVVVNRFDNEGSGMHSHLVYPWVVDATYRFLLGAKIDGDGTIYTGYFFDPLQKKWILIASFRAPKDGKLLRGLYSFDEDFSGVNGDLERRAEFGNQWIGTTDDKWRQLLQARFTHDETGKADRLDYEAKAIGGAFSLATGGFGNDPKTDFGSILIRDMTGDQPTDLQLPPIPPPS